jgi:hypothetical protein
VLRLAPLGQESAAELVAELAGGEPGPGLAHVAAGAAGNPLYLTELVDALDRAGALTVAGGIADVAAWPARATLATLTEAINDRLDFLPAAVRGVLQSAAMLGTEFTGADLLVVSGRQPADLLPALADARAADVLTESGDWLTFRHPLIRAAIYDALPAPARIARHYDAARALQRSGAAPDRVARQLLPAMTDASEDPSRPIEEWVANWLVEVARGLVADAAHVAVALLRPVVDHLPVEDPRRHILVDHLARALAHVADYPAVERIITETLPHVTDPATLVNLYETLVDVRVATRRGYEETLAELNRSMAEDRSLPSAHRLRLRVLAARIEIECHDLDAIEPAARQVLAEI